MTKRVEIRPTEVGNVSINVPDGADKAELVQFLRDHGLEIEVRPILWAGPYELIVAVLGGGGVATLINMWLQSKPSYTLTVTAEDGTTITREGRDLPSEEELEKIDELFRNRKKRPTDPDGHYGPVGDPI